MLTNQARDTLGSFFPTAASSSQPCRCHPAGAGMGTAHPITPSPFPEQHGAWPETSVWRARAEPGGQAPAEEACGDTADPRGAVLWRDNADERKLSSTTTARWPRERG